MIGFEPGFYIGAGLLVAGAVVSPWFLAGYALIVLLIWIETRATR